MFLLPIHVPIYADGDRLFVDSDWKRAVLLLRDSFEGRHGDIVVVSPRRTPDQSAGQVLEPVNDGSTEATRWVASFPERCRARSFWLRHRREWLRQLDPMIQRAAVVQASLDDVYRPIAYSAWRLARRRGRPTVFVQDTDIVRRVIETSPGKPLAQRLEAAAYARIFERWCRRGVAESDLSLLKGQALMQRYGRYARNARCFHNTSYRLSEVLPMDLIERRLASLPGRPLRLVYCGRLVARKGLLVSLGMVAAARARGANIEFDIIGDGEQRLELERQIARAGLGHAVRLLGQAPYDAALLRRLAEYDALLFTPLGEDTPRMIFDGYAAGLPLLGVGIAYVQERADQERATVILPAEVEAGGEVLARIDADRQSLVALSKAAYQAAVHHAAESWYQRRAEWTNQAIERHARETARG